MRGLLLACYFLVGFTTGTLYTVATEVYYQKGVSSVMMSLPVGMLTHIEVEEI